MTAQTPVRTPDVLDGYVLTVAEVAAAAEVAPSAVRFYEKHGVITGLRTPGNQRRFNSGAACRIRVAKLAQRVGLSVREIADLFADFPAEPEPGDWGRISEALVSDAEARVERLRRQLGALGSDSPLCEIDPGL